MVRKTDQAKHFRAAIFTANPPHWVTCSVCSPAVTDSGVDVTSYKWIAPNLSDPNKMDPYDIGEFRHANNAHRKPVVVGVYDPRLKAHRDRADAFKKRLFESPARQYDT